MNDDRLYSREHAWVRRLETGRCDIGLSAYAIEAFAGVGYVSFLVKPGDKVKAGDDLADIESRKSADTLKSPISGKILVIGPEIEMRPQILENIDGLISFILMEEDGERKDLMTREQYDEYVKTL